LGEYREKAQSNPEGPWTIDNGLLLFNGRLVVPDQDDIYARLLDEIHRQASIAHPGKKKTKELVRSRYYWPTWVKDVDRYIDNCLICKRTKEWHDKTPGLLKPLPIPDRPWQHISIDFCSFPKDRHGFDNVMVVVDRLSKRSISIPCQKTISALETARLFILHIYRWKGPPDTIISDRGGQFVSAFWMEFCKIIGAKLKLSTAHHPQTDGQTEIVNKSNETRLRPFISHYQDDWSEWLPMMDFAAAALLHESTGLAPAQIDNGFLPRTSFDWAAATPPQGLNVDQEAAQALVQRMEEIWDRAKVSIGHAQARQKAQADKHRREADFEVGDQVMVTMKHWKLSRPSQKLAEKAAGPFTILEKVGNAYRLDLPASIKVHPIFNPEKLRRAATTEPLRGQIPDPQPPIEVDGHEEYEVEQVLAVRLNRQKLQYRVKWIGHDDDPEWYPAGDFVNSPIAIRDFHAQYPDQPGPPKRLPIWLDAAEKEEFIPEHEEDNRAAGWMRRPQRLGTGA
jgi:transposase InsO family protein